MFSPPVRTGQVKIGASTARRPCKNTPNSRRERSPVAIEIGLDGQPLFRHIAPPSGLSKEGASTVYQRFTLPAGTYQLAVRFSDNVNKKDFGYKRAETVTLAPGKILVIDFNPEKGGITLI